MLYMYLWLKNWLEREEGQDLIEYALIVFLISIVVVGALTLVGDQLNAVWTQITADLGGG